MQPFIIDDNTKKAIERIKKHAELNVYTLGDMQEIIKGDETKKISGQEGFTTELPFGYKVVYSIEQQKSGNMRHLSVSSPKGISAIPNPKLVQEIMKLIGFRDSYIECYKNNLVKSKSEKGFKSLNVWEIK